MKTTYKNWSNTTLLTEIVTNPLIEVGTHSYYSGYYENQNFEDGCVRYLWGDETTRADFNPQMQFGWKLDKLKIGNYVSIASGVIILMGGNHNHHPDWITVYPFEQHVQDSYETKGDTCINSDAWLGMNALIMPGITVGEGAIVAAGSVVTKDVPPYTIVGGNPAKVIKQRFSHQEINQLLTIRWFDWTDEEVAGASSILMSGDIKKLVDYYETTIH